MNKVTIGVNALVGKALEENVGVVFYGQGDDEISSLKGLGRDVAADLDAACTVATLRPLTLTGELFVALLATGA